jgi:hypothetical protein
VVSKTAAEQSIRVLIAFFAALVGFGLKNLPDHPLPGGGWMAFLVAVALFLRFMTGAANHLWREHAKSGVKDGDKHLYVLDLTFLIVFGVIAALMCYACTTRRFLLLAMLLLTIALVWGFVDQCLHRKLMKGASTTEQTVYKSAMERWQFWRRMDLLQLLAFLLALVVIGVPRWEVDPLTIYGWTPSDTLVWLFLFVVNTGILGWDFVRQFGALSEPLTSQSGVGTVGTTGACGP